jgi:hypothetical protein
MVAAATKTLRNNSTAAKQIVAVTEGWDNAITSNKHNGTLLKLDIDR